jgi:hypothetical protein
MGHDAGRDGGGRAGAGAVLVAAAMALTGCFQAARGLEVGGVHVELDDEAAAELQGLLDRARLAKATR